MRIREIIWVRDTAIRDLIVGLLLGYGVSEDGELTGVGLLPIAPRQLVLGGIDKHDLKNGAKIP